MLIGSILTTFTTPYIASRATEFVKTVASTQVDGITKGQLLRSLGKRLCECAVLEDNHAEVFHGAWKTINTLTNANEYIQSVEPWTEYVGTYVGVGDFNTYICNIFHKSIFFMYKWLAADLRLRVAYLVGRTDES